jgi:hypothetical protein
MHKMTGLPVSIVECIGSTGKQELCDSAFRGLLVVGDRGVLGRQPIKDGADMLTPTVTLVKQRQEEVMVSLKYC